MAVKNVSKMFAKNNGVTNKRNNSTYAVVKEIVASEVNYPRWLREPERVSDKNINQPLKNRS